MTKLLKEPLLHFLILGAVLFLLYSIVSDSPEEETEVANAERVVSKEIVVTNARIENLVARFKQSWRRDPTEQERQGLIDEYIRDEVMYRQALTMNLDQDDPSVRKRMRQKLEFLTNDISDLSPPSEEELQAYLKENAQKYFLDAEFTFVQIFFSKKKHGDKLQSVIDATRAKLPEKLEGLDLRTVGDPTMLAPSMQGASRREVANGFGAAFANSLRDLPEGSWQGPIESGFGTHLVFLSERTTGEASPLDQVREEVKRDWMADMRTKSNEEVYQSWKTSFSITVEGESK